VRCVHLVVPDGVDDPRRPSGGNVYDVRASEELRAAGWDVVRHVVPRRSSGGATPAVGRALATLPDGSTVLVDGLVALRTAEVLVPESARLRVVVLVHMPVPDGTADAASAEGAVLRAAAGVVTTSCWSSELLTRRHGLASGRLHVALPGVDPAPPTGTSAGGGRLLCVANVAPWKGQDVLVEALAIVQDLPWRCTFVGSLDVDRGFTRRVQQLARGKGIAGRVEWAGALTAEELATRYADTDLLVHPSLGESYGMVVAEALARGVPVLGTGVGGVPEALGTTSSGVPGLLVPPAEPQGLARELRRWLTEPRLREQLVRAARARREALPPWSTTAHHIARVLEEVAQVTH
jgi:glycosyltransferase involved in cell wall biosynthesis